MLRASAKSLGYYWARFPTLASESPEEIFTPMSVPHSQSSAFSIWGERGESGKGRMSLVDLERRESQGIEGLQEKQTWCNKGRAEQEEKGLGRGLEAEGGIPERVGWIGWRCGWRTRAPEEILKQGHQMDPPHREKHPRRTAGAVRRQPANREPSGDLALRRQQRGYRKLELDHRLRGQLFLWPLPVLHGVAVQPHALWEALEQKLRAQASDLDLSPPSPLPAVWPGQVTSLSKS